ncbi:hypothetical protein H696_01418 [Fonticula alba]|uniref:dCMP deaminase n=1 Tax=Fonticula alba TaxID=691883 RepID=A0A058ZDI5_FONAL|nr:hypothetical protein H696_01418 [Fonticula alba]KCV72011.1 hypothetical protein H696_01418 [Fonticula alba]|eukprot:XP_009493589.1 hypothetical protein H696_01418 [Fonticula alba]
MLLGLSGSFGSGIAEVAIFLHRHYGWKVLLPGPAGDSPTPLATPEYGGSAETICLSDHGGSGGRVGGDGGGASALALSDTEGPECPLLASLRERCIEAGLSPATLAPEEALRQAMSHTGEHFVLLPLTRREQLDQLLGRPAFSLLSVDAPTRARFRWHCHTDGPLELGDFLDLDDALSFGGNPIACHPSGQIREIAKLSDHQILLPEAGADGPMLERLLRMEFPGLLRLPDALSRTSASKAAGPDLQPVPAPSSPAGDQHIQLAIYSDLPLATVPEELLFFARLTRAVAQRSNCLKRRVGCVIVRGGRIVAVGHNGTPERLPPCYDGGCDRCADQQISRGEALDNCVCLHAEELAIIEAGSQQTDGCVLFCTTFPCVGCAKRIIHAGIQKVYYLDAYSPTDGKSEHLMRISGVKIARLKIPDPVVTALAE